MDHDRSLRKHLVDLLTGEHAHLGFDAAIDQVPRSKRGTRPAGAPHSPWELLEHLRIGQWDILEFSRDAKHVSPKWPDGYWPSSAEPPDDDAWSRSADAFRNDLREIVKLVEDPATDLYARIAHGTGQTILREVTLVADHNAYHLGQLVFVAKMLRG